MLKPNDLYSYMTNAHYIAQRMKSPASVELLLKQTDKLLKLGALQTATIVMDKLLSNAISINANKVNTPSVTKQNRGPSR